MVNGEWLLRLLSWKCSHRQSFLPFTIPHSLFTFPSLSPMPQVMISDGAGKHGFADRHRADADAWVVPSLGDDIHLVALPVHRTARIEDGGGRLHRKAGNDRLAGRDAAEDTARIVGEEARLAFIAGA